MFPFVQFLGPIHASSSVSLALFVALMAVVMGVTASLSALTYRFVERAGHRLVRQWVPTTG